MNELGHSIRIERIHSDDSVPVAALSMAIQYFQKRIEQISVVLLGKAQLLSGIIQAQQQWLVDGRHIHNSDAWFQLGCGQCLMPAAGTGYDYPHVLTVFPEDVAF